MKSNVKSLLLTVFLGFTIVFAGYAALKEVSESDMPQTPAATNASTAQAENPNNANEPRARGELLYQNHCRSCHESLVHIRSKRRVKSLADLQYWVGRWSVEVDLKWSGQEIEDVTYYLNKLYYQY